jgi:hypothetical protein
VLVEPSATRVVGLRHHPGWSEDLLAEAAAAVCRAGLFDAEAGVGALAHADRALSLRYTTGTIARTARPTRRRRPRASARSPAKSYVAIKHAAQANADGAVSLTRTGLQNAWSQKSQAAS